MALPSKVYVFVNSKAELNRRIKAGERFEALYYGLPHNDVFNLEDLRHGCVVAVFNKYVNGTPYAKAWGTVNRKADGSVTVS